MNKKILIITTIILIAVIALIVYSGVKENNKKAQNNQTTISSTIKSNDETAEKTTVAQATTENTKSGSNENSQNNASLPLTVNTAMNLLQERYGKAYTVNSTVEEDGINYFAIYRDNVKYASVKINLATGEATETIIETNTKTNFNLN